MIVDYNSILDAADHELILAKAIAIFEDEALCNANLRRRAVVTPDLSRWKDYRAVVVHWRRHARICAEANLSPEELQLLEDAVLRSDVLDGQILDVFKACPKRFTIQHRLRGGQSLLS